VEILPEEIKTLINSTPMPDNEVSLINSSIGGDFIGRDYNPITIINPVFQSAYLENLYNQFQVEKETNPELKEFSEELDYFNSSLDEDVIGLENKLIAGNRQKIINYAIVVKEKFHKKLMKTSQYSSIAQDINVYILTKVRRGFMMEVYTLICNNEPEEKINLIITERIINPVKAELGLNLFKYDEDDIMGMIFFLTGNCHLKWTA
jgi:hypothetical protein